MVKMVKSLEWDHTVNVIIPDAGSAQATLQNTIYAIKELFVANGWTVKRSALKTGAVTSTTGSSGNGDLWTNPSLILGTISGAYSKSWVILKNLTTNWEIMISIVSANLTPYLFGAIVRFSPGGLFTGGTHLAEPTATDSVSLIEVADFLTLNASSQRVLHFMQSTDKRVTRLFQLSGNNSYTSLFIEGLANAHPTLNSGVIAHSLGGANNRNYANLHRSSSQFSARRNDNAVSVALSCEGLLGLGMGEIWNVADVDGELPNIPVKAYSVTAANLCRLGTMQDFWFGPTLSVARGDTYPDEVGNSRQFVQFDHIILPWNGSLPVIA